MLTSTPHLPWVASPAHSDFRFQLGRSVDPLSPRDGGHTPTSQNPDTSFRDSDAGPMNQAIDRATDFEAMRDTANVGTNISGGTFIGGNVNHIESRGEPGLHILYRAAANDAFHDSVERYPQPRCHPETRTWILDDLYTWSSKDDRSSRVLWLYGPAGAGKSAIAQSFCQKLEAEGRLGGSFFFKRGHASRGNANKLFPTIAYQLALLPEPRRPESQRDMFPALKRVISQTVEGNPSVLHRSFAVSLQKLIIEPCQQNARPRPVTILIDGLDECDSQNVQLEILRSIGNVIHGQHIPVRFLVASRPEPHITEIFRDSYLDAFHHPLNIQQSFLDVRKYLCDEFARISREHHETMRATTTAGPRPSPEDVSSLVWNSSGYFIYASTVIKFIDDKNFRPTERLAVIMGIQVPDSDFESPFTALDQLYIQILAAVPAQSRLLRILTIIAAQFRLSVRSIEGILKLQPGDVLLSLRGLHSVIQVTGGNHLSVHHASFRDFLDPVRSGAFCVGDVLHRTELALHILKAFSHTHNETWQCREPVAW
ncbi:hypothetical protein C8R44DRAFT_717374 [Mycena epipterygia]|nr:hypothetical protein C8R44DRAFT_717374 [Mycena epipterygia]